MWSAKTKPIGGLPASQMASHLTVGSKLIGKARHSLGPESLKKLLHGFAQALRWQPGFWTFGCQIDSRKHNRQGLVLGGTSTSEQQHPLKGGRALGFARNQVLPCKQLFSLTVVAIPGGGSNTESFAVGTGYNAKGVYTAS